ncbi:MAG: sugar kinase [Chitinophagaceae bacterium]|nr:sugar kinase [Chitinophagaceae bacterium]
MQKKFDVLVVGELNVDLIFNQLTSLPQVGKERLAGEMCLTLGSSAAIFASNLSVLGARVTFVAKTGRDVFGDFCVERLQLKGVDTSMLMRHGKLTTGATVVLNFGEDRAMVTHQGAMSYLGPDDITEEMLSAARHLHFSSYFLQPAFKGRLGDLFRRAKEAGLTTSLDVQWDPAEEWDLDLPGVLPFVDIFLPNESELLCLTGKASVESALGFIGRAGNFILVKQGREGSTLWHKDKLCRGVPFINHSVVDAIGAGDSFNAGYIFKFLQAVPPEECQRFANLIAAISTTAAGGTTAFLNYEETINIGKSLFGYEA